MKDKYFIYTGNAYPHKNLDRLIKAIYNINKDANKLIKLKIITSRNVFYKRLVKIIEKYNSSEFIEIIGFVEDSELFKLYKNSVAFVFPSLSEGFGLPGIEAMREGTILLASDIPVFKEVYENNAIYFNPHDVNSIKNSLEKSLNMTFAEREGRIKKGLEFVKKYSWHKMAIETLKIYESITK